MWSDSIALASGGAVDGAATASPSARDLAARHGKPDEFQGGHAYHRAGMHLHPGDHAALADTGEAFVADHLPPFRQVHAPEVTRADRLS